MFWRAGVCSPSPNAGGTVRLRGVIPLRKTLMRRRRKSFHPSLLLPALLSLATALFASSCLTSPTKGSPTGRTELKRQVAQRDKTIVQLQQGIAEKEALIKQLEQSMLAQQRMLDDAIQEVVRIQAKQRNLESRAEAASEMAEAEIALKSLRDRSGESGPPELANAGQLLTRATREFDAQNFGGALYLAGQAKSHVKMGELRIEERRQAGPGGGDEIPFAVPLPLTLGARGNLREGPGQEFKVIATLDPGTRVTGYFTRGSWLRVESADGQSGWIHRSLVNPN